jgi:CRP/FNR family transcriptional regulator, cyclic AMP receptor protein
VRSINPQTLAGLEAFRVLALEQREAVASLCHYHSFEAHQLIISHLDRSCEVYFIISGQAQAVIYSSDGRQVTLQLLEAGQMFGEIAAIDRQPRTCSVVATSDCEVLTMAPNDFMATVHNHPAFADVILQRLTRMVRQLSSAVFERDALPVRQRIHNVMLRLALEHLRDDNSALIIPAPTHADIAHFTGVRRETVSRELARLKKAGFVDRRDGVLIIQRVTELARMFGEQVHSHLSLSIR